MCGIVGYLGNEDARELILKGLTRLEYRGYDSAGIALYNNKDNVFTIYKDKGRVDNLKQLTDFSYITHQGIGHTRWATHGIPNKINSHPHKSSTDSFYIVHNGVIDNYLELKQEYLPESVFESDTDTEVIAHLIEKFSQSMNTSEAIRKTMSLLEGSYALAIIETSDSTRLYAAKNK